MFAMGLRQDIESEKSMYLLYFNVAMYSNARSIACDSPEKLMICFVVLFAGNDAC